MGATMSLTRFTVEYVRVNPQLTVPQAISAATQVATGVEMRRYKTFDALVALARGLQLRSAFEWETYGYVPTEKAVPVQLERTDEELVFDTYYLAEHMTRPQHSHERLQPFEEFVRDRRQRVRGGEVDYSAEFSHLPTRRLTMMGNLWRFGIVVTLSDSLGRDQSRTLRPSTPLPGERPDPTMTEYDAWFHINVNPGLGRDTGPEIMRAAAAVVLGDESAVPGSESEAAAYIALERLWIPARRMQTQWFRDYAADDPLPEGFDWNRVYETAQRLETVLRGEIS